MFIGIIFYRFIIKCIKLWYNTVKMNRIKLKSKNRSRKYFIHFCQSGRKISMEIIMGLAFFIYGTIWGSFFNVVGLRVPNKTFFKQKRSYCDHCRRTLSWIELIPIVSYIFSHGRCKKCQQKISPLYPIIECLTGIIFAFTYYRVGWNPTLILGLLLISLVIPITVSDLVYQKIPNSLLLFFTPLFILYRFFYPLNPWWNSLTGALFAFILIFTMIFLSQGGMGMGDLKYFTLLGFIFGIPQFLLLLFFSSLFCSVAGLTLLTINKNNLKKKIPFGPSIGLAALLIFYYGEEIIQRYLQLFY